MRLINDILVSVWNCVLHYFSGQYSTLSKVLACVNLDQILHLDAELMYSLLLLQHNQSRVLFFLYGTHADII